MADLDEISMRLGEISSDIKHALAWMKDHELQNQDRFEMITQQLNDHQTVVEQVRSAKKFVIWAATALGTLSGTIATYVSKWWGGA